MYNVYKVHHCNVFALFLPFFLYYTILHCEQEVNGGYFCMK